MWLDLYISFTLVFAVESLSSQEYEAVVDVCALEEFLEALAVLLVHWMLLQLSLCPPSASLALAPVLCIPVAFSRMVSIGCSSVRTAAPPTAFFPSEVLGEPDSALPCLEGASRWAGLGMMFVERACIALRREVVNGERLSSRVRLTL